MVESVTSVPPYARYAAGRAGEREEMNRLNYAPPPHEAFPPLPRRVWRARLIILSIFGLFALFGFGVVASLAFALFTEWW